MNSLKQLIVVLAAIVFTMAEIQAAEMPKVSGDLRYRHERKSEISGGANKATERERIRARLKVSSKISDKLTATLRLATGGPSTSPNGGGSVTKGGTSTNETLDDNGSNDEFDLDLAYASWKVLSSLSFDFGKMPMPFYRAGGNDTIFDGDWTPEGTALIFKKEMGKINLNGSFSRFWMQQSSNAAPEMLMAPQLYVTWAGPVNVTVGASRYDFTSASTTSYKINEFFGEVGMKVGQFNIDLFGSSATNGEVDGTDPKDSSYYAGTSIKCSKTKLKLTYDYRRSEANSSPDTINDGDSCGGRNINGCYGHRYGVSGKISDVGWGVKYFDHRIITTQNHYNVLQADLKIKF